MNKVILTGNLCKDVELRKTNTGKSVTSNTIAVSRDMKDASGNYISDFIDLVLWEKSAEYLTKYGHKGDRAEVVGRWQNRTYQDKNGQNRTVSEVQVENIKVFSKAPAAAQKEEESNKSNDINTEDLPF